MQPEVVLQRLARSGRYLTRLDKHNFHERFSSTLPSFDIVIGGFAGLDDGARTMAGFGARSRAHRRRFGRHDHIPVVPVHIERI